MIELTEEQLIAIDRDSEPRFVDPRTQATYVLVGSELYERLRGRIDDDDLDMKQVAVLVDRAMRDDDKHDPTLAFYQEKYGAKS